MDRPLAKWDSSETFMQLVTLIQWTEHTVKAFKAASKLQHKLVWTNRAGRFAIYEAGRGVLMVFRISFQIDGRV